VGLTPRRTPLPFVPMLARRGRLPPRYPPRPPPFFRQFSLYTFFVARFLGSRFGLGDALRSIGDSFHFV
jgi:hypothetical protein